MFPSGTLALFVCALSLLSVAHGSIANLSLLAFSGTPVGRVINHNGLDIYQSKPKDQQASNGTGQPDKPLVGVLLLTDVFGIQANENKLLTDSFARAGYVSIAPDLFEGKPRPEDPKSAFDAADFFGRHGPNATDPIVSTALSYMREQLGVSKVAAVGYCFGGRYVFRALGLPQGKGVSAAFAAHPTLLGDDEIKAIKGPASLAIAERDTGMLIQRRVEIEAAMANTGQPFTMNLYGGVPHGFATRPNLEIPLEKAGKEDAFLQAVRFFETWV